MPSRSTRRPLTLLAGAWLAVAPQAGASVIRARVDFTPQDVRIETVAARTQVRLEGVSAVGGRDHPELPMAELAFYVPEGREVADVRVVTRDEVVVGRNVSLAAAPGAALADRSGGGRAFPSAATTTVSRIFPARPGVSLSDGNLGGFTLHSVGVFPMRWDRGTGDLTLARSVEVELETRPAAIAGGNVVRRRASPVADEIFRRALRNLVVNPSDLARASRAVPRVDAGRGFAPEALPSEEGSGVDMVIVTTAALESHLQPLADWKTRKGVPTVVRSLDWIEANYPAGRDVPERVRSFLRDAYEKWGTYIVLIAGDYDDVPPRMAWETFFWGGREVATDQYYSCLDGDWNGDGDHLWGEGSTTQGVGDGADLYPDVFVGRAPVADSAEVATFVAKSFTYDRTPPAGYVESHGVLGEVLFPADWEFGDSLSAISLDGKWLIEDSLDTRIPAGWSRSKRYQSDGNEDRTIALAELNFGHHVLTINGHGDAFKFSVGNAPNPLIQIPDTQGLTNGDRLSVTVATACNPNEFDLECQGESLLHNPSGGSIAVFGPSREDFPISATQFHANMYRLFFSYGVSGFGAASQLCRVKFVAQSQSDTNPDRWTMLTKMMMGDPELRMWTREPEALVVSHAASAALGTSALTVTVTDTLSAPVSGALVCLSDGNGTYSRVLTGATGQATLPITSVSPGTMDLVVTKRDFRVHEGTFGLNAPAGAHLAKSSESFDDDGTGASSGNGDGLVDAGETIELGVTVKNEGGTSASNVSVTGTIEGGTSATFQFLYGGTLDPSRVFIGPDRVNPTVVPFALSFANPVIDYIGRPTFAFAPDTLSGGAPAGDEGIFVWQDSEGWHVVWGTSADLVAVSGTITTDGRVRWAGSVSADPTTDAFAVSTGGDSLTFSSTVSQTHLSSGVDFGLSDGTMLTLTSASDSLGAIAPSGQGTGTLVLDVSSSARAGQIGYVDLSMTSTSGGPWSGETAMVFAGPELEAYVFSVQDSGPGLSGDGDGVIEEGETVRLTPTVINRGNGQAEAVSGLATSLSGVAFTDAADAYGNIPSLAETPGTDGYVFTVLDSSGASIDLTLTDSLGRTWLKTMDFVAAAPPGSLWFASATLAIDVIWSPVTSPDLAGYNVYRSTVSGSGHMKQNFELLRSGSGFEDTGLAPGSSYFYRVTAVDSSGNESPASPELHAWTTQVQVTGWPQTTQERIYPGIALADADGDGNQEIYVGSNDDQLHAWDHDGTVRAGFPAITGNDIWSTAAVADVDGDSDLEIAFGSRDGKVYAVHHDGTPLVPPNPGFGAAGTWIRAAVTIADVAGSAFPEMLFGSDGGDVYAFHHDGTGVIDSTGLLYATTGSTSNIWGTIAVADMDGDGIKEIAFSSWNDKVYVIDGTGTLRPGFPRAGSSDFRGGSVLGDLDGDGNKEVVSVDLNGNIWAFNHDGTDHVPGGVLATVPGQVVGGVALANLDGDPQLEIILGSLDGHLYAYHHDGASFLSGQGGLLASIDPSIGISASPIVADVDGDGDFEIFVGHRNGLLYGYHHDGSPVVGLPVPTGDSIYSTAAAGDIDGDGDVDIAFASYDASVNVLDFAGPSTPQAYEWPTHGANNHRTATYGDAGSVTAVSPVVATAYRLGLGQNVPNPFARGTTIRYTVPAEQDVTIQIFNVQGRLVRTLVNGRVPAGPSETRWDGRDGRGNALSSGIYFYQLDAGRESITRKGVLLR